ncbi:hypothetical protein BDV11DRAFT_173576 [Aspergillus similis]
MPDAGSAEGTTAGRRREHLAAEADVGMGGRGRALLRGLRGLNGHGIPLPVLPVVNGTVGHFHLWWRGDMVYKRYNLLLAISLLAIFILLAIELMIYQPSQAS